MANKVTFIMKLLKGLAYIPSIIMGIENVFGSGEGKTKFQKVTELSDLVIGKVEAIAEQDIIDEKEFAEGQRMVNDGVVKMLNASVWHKKNKELGQ